MKQEVTFTNSKGQKLNGRFVTPENYKATVVLVHGLNGTIDEWHDFPELVKAGYRVFSFDMIGRGKSEGDYEDTSFDLNLDCLNSAIEFIGEPVVVVGRSFGAVTAIACTVQNPKVRCLVTFAPGRSLSFVDYEEAKEKGFFIISNPNHRYKFALLEDTRKADLLNKAREIKAPWLIIHGEDDKYICVEEAKQLYENANEPKKLVLLKDKGHEIYIKEPAPEAVQETIEWLDKVFIG